MEEATGNTENKFEYINFTPRLYASLIDMALTLLLVLPVLSLGLSALFGGIPPSMQLQSLSGNPEFMQNVETMAERGAGILEVFSYSLQQINVSSWLTEEAIKLLVSAAVVIIFWHYRSATPGKILLRMRIVDAKTGEEPSTLQWVIRFFAYTLSTLPFCLGFVWMIWDKKKQCFHDKIAGTVVIKDKRPKAKKAKERLF